MQPPAPLRAALRTVLVEGLPPELRSEADLRAQFESLLGVGCVEKVSLRDSDAVGEDAREAEENPIFSSVFGESGFHSEIADDASLPASIIGHARLGSKRVLRVAGQLIVNGLSAARGVLCPLGFTRERAHAVPSALITFTRHATWLQAVQLSLHDGISVSPGPYPSDVVEGNVGRSPRSIRHRTAVVEAALVGGLLLWSMPVAAIQVDCWLLGSRRSQMRDWKPISF